MASVYLPFKVSLSSQPPAQREVGAGVFFVNQTGERCVHRKSHITPAPQNAVKYVRSEHALAREAASHNKDAAHPYHRGLDSMGEERS